MFAAVILAGGGARRLSGVDKPAIEIAGRSLLDRAVASVAGADPVVVVGPRRALAVGVRWTREDPPGAGPLAALAAGLTEVGPLPAEATVALVAADLVNVVPDTIGRLRDGLGDAAARRVAARAAAGGAAGRGGWPLAAVGAVRPAARRSSRRRRRGGRHRHPGRPGAAPVGVLHSGHTGGAIACSSG